MSPRGQTGRQAGGVAQKTKKKEKEKKKNK
jgi:hypothetical protein